MDNNMIFSEVTRTMLQEAVRELFRTSVPTVKNVINRLRQRKNDEGAEDAQKGLTALQIQKGIKLDNTLILFLEDNVGLIALLRDENLRIKYLVFSTPDGLMFLHDSIQPYLVVAQTSYVLSEYQTLKATINGFIQNVLLTSTNLSPRNLICKIEPKFAEDYRKLLSDKWNGFCERLRNRGLDQFMNLRVRVEDYDELVGRLLRELAIIASDVTDSLHEIIQKPDIFPDDLRRESLDCLVSFMSTLQTLKSLFITYCPDKADSLNGSLIKVHELIPIMKEGRRSEL